MQMTDDEIRMRYRDGAPIQVLAELNACGHERIEEIVKGVKRRKDEEQEAAAALKQKNPPRKKLTKEEIEARRKRIEEMARAGIPYAEIARELKCAPSVVKDHCNRCGIPSRYTCRDGGRKTREKMRKREHIKNRKTA